ncbi:MAG: sugar ABC transporter permease [Treponema sp.]|jgi:multiple sugar transport system permease protein|nr:sugar ABC transporter permease [Treponema sp.]
MSGSIQKHKKRYINSSTLNTWLWGYFFIAPLSLGLLFFVVGPVGYALFISLTDWDGFTVASFIGFRNFINIFRDPQVLLELFNTLKYMGGVVPATLIIAIVIANLLNTDVHGKGFFRVAFFLPMVTMASAVAIVWKWLFNSQYGIINIFLRPFGLNPQWMGNPDYIMAAVIVVAVWGGIGYAAIILLAGLQSIPKNYYEAASIDGADPWCRFIRITVPLLSPTIFFLTITSMINAFKAFDLIFMFAGTGNSTSPTTEAVRTMVFGIYQKGFLLRRMGYAAAEAVLLFGLILLVTVIQFRLQKKLVYYD